MHTKVNDTSSLFALNKALDHVNGLIAEKAADWEVRTDLLQRLKRKREWFKHAEYNHKDDIAAINKQIAELEDTLRQVPRQRNESVAVSPTTQLLRERDYIEAMIARRSEKPAAPDQTHRLRQLAGLAPLQEAWDPDDYDRYANPDNAFGVSRHGTEQMGASGMGDGSMVPGDESEDAMRRRLGIRPPHVGPKAAGPKSMSRRRSMQVDPKIAAQLRDYTSPVGDDGDDDDELEMAADAAASEVPPSEATAQSSADVSATPASAVATTAAVPTAKGHKSKAALAFLQANPKASRSEFIAWGAQNGMSKNYCNTFLYSEPVKHFRALLQAGDTAGAANVAADVNGNVVEVWTVENEKGRVLAEGGSYDTPMWTSLENVGIFEPRVFMNENHARKAVEALAKYGYTKVKLVKETL